MGEIYKSSNNIFSYQLPGNFISEESEGILNIFRETGPGGAICISNYGIPDDYYFDKAKELLEFVKCIEDNEILLNNIIIIEGNEYSCSEFIANKLFWKVNVYFQRPYAIFISYNCTPGEQDLEANEVDSIIRSVKFSF